MSVKVIALQKRTTEDGKREFVALTLQGGVEVLKSKKSGMPYVTARKVNIVSTFDEDTAKQMIGKTLPGTIDKIPCEPYDFVTKTGETVSLDFKYAYNPDSVTSEEAVFS